MRNIKFSALFFVNKSHIILPTLYLLTYNTYGIAHIRNFFYYGDR